ncbi:MAG: hypothetical protein IJ561_05450 [Ruminococcus sp.]|nr:hypothetical protein [Ruminococcus sp.]
MDKKKVLDKSVKAVGKAMKIRRVLKQIFAFGTGISTGIATYRIILPITENKPYTVALAVLAGAATTAFALLFMEIIRLIIDKLKKAGLWLWDKRKPSKKESEDSDGR